MEIKIMFIPHLQQRGRYMEGLGERWQWCNHNDLMMLITQRFHALFVFFRKCFDFRQAKLSVSIDAAMLGQESRCASSHQQAQTRKEGRSVWGTLIIPFPPRSLERAEAFTLTFTASIMRETINTKVLHVSRSAKTVRVHGELMMPPRYISLAGGRQMVRASSRSVGGCRVQNLQKHSHICSVSLDFMHQVGGVWWHFYLLFISSLTDF